jgi:beta-glucosidase
MYGVVNYLKEKYQNPTIIISENGTRNNLSPSPEMLAFSSIMASTNHGAMNITISGMDQPGNLTREEYLHDTIRIDFYKNYLTELKKGMDDGANVVGYFAWSLLDNFEWLSGYTSKFGIVYVDFTTLKRYPKDSAYWFKDMLSGTGSKAATPQTGSGTRPAGSPSATSNGAALLVSLFVSLCVLLPSVFMVSSV